MLEKSSWDNLSNVIRDKSGSCVKFISAHAATLPESSGVYVVCLKPKSDGPSFLGQLYNAVYVGQSVNLRQRFKQHLSGRTSVKYVLTEFSKIEFWYLLCDVSELDFVERTIYDVLCPITNKVSPPKFKGKLLEGLPTNP